MRDDMSKVIVERPRWGHDMNSREGRRFRAEQDYGGKAGMMRGYGNRKHFSENLAPLARWLASQVNRPWDKVYSELCANIDRRNTVQEHIFAHIENFVALDTKLVDGKVVVFGGWPRRNMPIEEARMDLYVHPRTRLLLRNRHRVGHSKLHQRKLAAEAAALAKKRRALSDTAQLHCLDGVWYLVTLARIAPPRVIEDPEAGREGRLHYPMHWDALRNAAVVHGVGDRELYGNPHVFAVSKRQLSHSELKRYRLTNENAGETRRFHLLRTNVRVAHRSISSPPCSPWLPTRFSCA